MRAWEDVEMAEPIRECPNCGAADDPEYGFLGHQCPPIFPDPKHRLPAGGWELGVARLGPDSPLVLRYGVPGEARSQKGRPWSKTDRTHYECGEGYAHPLGQRCTGQCVLRA